MAERDDDRLLHALAVALRPDASVEPSLSELMALQAVVSDVRAGALRGRPSQLRRWVAGLLAGGVVLSGGTAYATNPVAPRPVRSAAFALKLPVEAPDLTDAKEALDDLEEELREGRRDKVEAAVDDVLDELIDLSATARRSLEPRASALLATASAFLEDAADAAQAGDAADDARRDSNDGDPGDDGSDSGSDDDPSRSGSDSGSEGDSSGSGFDSGSEDDSSGSGSDSRGSDSEDDPSGDGSDSSGSGSKDLSGRDSDEPGGTDSDDPSGSESDTDSDDDGGVSASGGGEPASVDD